MAATTPDATAIPSDIKRKLERGRTNHKKWLPGWAECLSFIEGRQFVFQAKASTGTALQELETREWGDKDPNRARTVRNRVLGFYLSEISMGTQRVPSYEVSPENNDPEIINAARLGEKVLLYLYDFLRLRKSLVECYGYAVSCGEGFLRPYWDPSAGQMLPPVCPDCGQITTAEIGTDTVCTYCQTAFTVEGLHEGELCVRAYGPHEVYWEPGLMFDRSPWHAIDTAMTISQAQQLPGFYGGDLRPDTQAAGSFIQGQISRQAASPDTVMVTEYLELPSDTDAEGRRFYMANGRQITPTDPYPMIVQGPEGPEPVILKVPYVPTPWRDRDMGLVEHLVDAQRTYNDCVNKGIEHKNLFIHPHWTAPVGSMTAARMKATAGGITYYNVVGGGQQKPEPVVAPPIPDGLFRMADQAIADMEEISSQRGLPDTATSGVEISARIERDQIRRQFVIQALADFHSRLGHHLLAYVQKYFTEARNLVIAGHAGAEYVYDFKGADLKNQLAVRVLPGSIEPQTRAAMEQKILAYADRGWISPDRAMAAIDNGTVEDLAKDFELDEAKQQRENQAMEAAGSGLPGAALPDAAPFDNHQVHLGVLHARMKTREWESLPEGVRVAFQAHEAQHQQFLRQQAAEAQAAQVQTAQQLGMANATRPSSGQMPPPPKTQP